MSLKTTPDSTTPSTNSPSRCSSSPSCSSRYDTGQRWAWWVCWAVMIANLGYTLTFGQHDPQILRRSLTADIAVPLLLLATVKQTLRHAAAGPRGG